MSGIYTREEIEKVLNDPTFILRATSEGCEWFPDLKPSAIAKLIVIYGTKLKEVFGIEG